VEEAAVSGRVTQPEKTTETVTVKEGNTMFKLLGALVAACVSFIATTACAQTYPDRPVTIIVPFGAGSGTDSISRLLGHHLSAALKQTVVIEPKPGANGAIAATYVARSAPDGYTLIMGTNSPHSAVPYLTKNVAYDPVKDFAPITRVGSYTLLLVVNPEIPAKSVGELIAYAKANPGKLTFASGNTSGIVAGETLKHWAKIDVLHVPYKSVPPALNDVLAGRVSMMFADLTTALPHVRANTLRALGATRKARSALFPEVPSLHEAGVTDFEMDSWAGLFAPAATPPDIVARLNSETRRIIGDPEIKGKFAAMGFEAFTSTPEEFDKFVKAQLVSWGKMIKDAGIEPE
jgi:putative tricarboxylic transport membrane protein